MTTIHDRSITSQSSLAAQEASADALIRSSLVCEAMLPWECTDKSLVILDRYAACGFDFISITMATDDSPGDAAGDALRSIAELRCLVGSAPAKFQMVRTAADIEHIAAAGKVGISLNFQGTLPFGKTLSLVEPFYELGVRQVLLAYNQQNFVCEGCSERTDSGLSKFGVSLVKELHRVGVLVDGTHCGYRATMEAIEIGDGRPFIFSHSNAFSIYPHYRNIKDDQIRACAATNGFVGINGLNLFLGDIDARAETMFNHIDHIASLVGIDHVGLGLDYVQFEDPIDDYYERNPDVWPTNPYNGRPMRGIRSAQPEVLSDLVKLMLEHGYSIESVRKVLGLNYLRVTKTVWK